MSSYLSGPVGHKWTSPMHFDSTFLEMNIMKLLEFVLKNSYFTSEQDHYPQKVAERWRLQKVPQTLTWWWSLQTDERVFNFPPLLIFYDGGTSGKWMIAIPT